MLLPSGNSCTPPSRLYLLIYNYIRSLLHCSSKNTVTALLEYLDLDCSIPVSQIIDTIELGSPSQLQIILGGLSPHNSFHRGCSSPSLPPLVLCCSRNNDWKVKKYTDRILFSAIWEQSAVHFYGLQYEKCK